MKKEKLKTLKDLKIAGHKVVRQEAIKWIKEDFEWIKEIKNSKVQQELIILEYEWMKRLDIIDEDLKDEVKDDL